MSGKSLILIGLGASALYTYFCISTHKDQLYEKLYPAAVTGNIGSDTVKEEPTPLVQQVVEKDNPSFSFVNGEPYQFNATLEREAEQGEMMQQVTQWCQAKPCSNNIQFLENVKKETWSKEGQGIVSFMIDNQIKDGAISIKENTIHVSGNLKTQEQQESLKELLSTFDTSYQVQNETTLEEVAVTENKESTTNLNTEEPKVIQEVEVKEEQASTPTEETSNIEAAQAEINTLLKNAVINFKFNSSEIVPSSKKVLDNIIQIVNNLNAEVSLNIAGHTDASGSASYNKKLSQQRANSVQQYLLEKGIKAQGLTSIGYGEEKLIFAPNDKKNRRVEIALKKGE